MTKRQLVKWLEAQRAKALKNEENHYRTAQEEFIEKRNSAIKLDEVADTIYDLLSKAEDVVTKWKYSIDNSEIVSTRNGYFGSMSSTLYELCDKSFIRNKLQRDFCDSSSTISDLKKADGEIQRGINANYNNVIANVQNMRNAKDAAQYLQELGFDLSGLIEADQHPVSTALSVRVDTRFLFIGGVEDEEHSPEADTNS